jgi:hypothetical protein
MEASVRESISADADWVLWEVHLTPFIMGIW